MPRSSIGRAMSRNLTAGSCPASSPKKRTFSRSSPLRGLSEDSSFAHPARKPANIIRAAHAHFSKDCLFNIKKEDSELAEAVPARKKHQRSYQLPHGNNRQSTPHPGRATAKMRRDKSYRFSSSNRRAGASIARAVASRSSQEAPKNPATPFVFSKTYCTSSGSARGPPWHR